MNETRRKQIIRARTGLEAIATTLNAIADEEDEAMEGVREFNEDDDRIGQMEEWRDRIADWAMEIESVAENITDED